MGILSLGPFSNDFPHYYIASNLKPASRHMSTKMLLTLRLVAAALLFSPSTLAAYTYNYTENVLTHPPNETQSITFKPFPDDPDLKNSEWTWRVNITDTPTPGQQINYPFFFSDNTPLEARGLVVTWDFVWPEGGVLSETLSQNAPTICASMPFTLTYLPKVTNLWPGENYRLARLRPRFGPDLCGRHSGHW
ncbi:hypothetical protein V8F06_013959 [Rhypophila decipiens]